MYINRKKLSMVYLEKPWKWMTEKVASRFFKCVVVTVMKEMCEEAWMMNWVCEY